MKETLFYNYLRCRYSTSRKFIFEKEQQKMICSVQLPLIFRYRYRVLSVRFEIKLVCFYSRRAGEDPEENFRELDQLLPGEKKATHEGESFCEYK
jgi:hypothetical protein